MYVKTVKDLINFPAYSWEALRNHQNLGPIIMPLLKKDIDQLRLSTGESNNGKKKEEREKTNGEILADIHKIKRFLFYETKAKIVENHNEEAKFLMGQMAYLSKKALKEGFDEQKRDEDFDGGPILGKIQSYLEENFATSDLPSIIKPSRGIILVTLFFFKKCLSFSQKHLA
jgi:hypothetical protein